MRLLQSVAKRGASLVAGIGCLCIAAAAFLPVAVARRWEDRGGPFLPYFEGFLIVALAALAFFAVLLAHSGKRVRVLGGPALIVLGVVSVAYVDALTARVPWCHVHRCGLTTAPQGGITYPPVEPGLALASAVTGGVLLVVAGFILTLLVARGATRTWPRPIVDRGIYL